MNSKITALQAKIASEKKIIAICEKAQSEDSYFNADYHIQVSRENIATFERLIAIEVTQANIQRYRQQIYAGLRQRYGKTKPDMLPFLDFDLNADRALLMQAQEELKYLMLMRKAILK